MYTQKLTEELTKKTEGNRRDFQGSMIITGLEKVHGNSKQRSKTISV